MQKTFLKKQKNIFQTKVYEAVKKIPRGKTWTYQEVAQKIGHPRAWRLVGTVLSFNIDPNVPCHRVIRSDGKVGGYRSGEKNKIIRLKEEGVRIKDGKIVG